MRGRDTRCDGSVRPSVRLFVLKIRRVFDDSLARLEKREREI